jgi:hypothetical protein
LKRCQVGRTVVVGKYDLPFSARLGMPELVLAILVSIPCLDTPSDVCRPKPVLTLTPDGCPDEETSNDRGV